MKRFSSSDSLGCLVYPPEDFFLIKTEKKDPKENCVYSREFQAMLDGLDEEDSIEEGGQSMEKKKRLSINQVKALEKIFEVDSRLDPQTKSKLAQELGLQPRQVAIWFQNRRARWKTKQLERDYKHLKANYDALKLNHEKLEKEKETLIAELRELKERVEEEDTKSSLGEKEASVLWGSRDNVSGQRKDSNLGLSVQPEAMNINYKLGNNISFGETNNVLVDFRNGISDGDSGGVFNDESKLISQDLPPSTIDYSSFLASSSALNNSQGLDSRAVFMKAYQQNLFGTDECFNILAVDQAPSLCCYLLPDPRS